MVPKFTGFTLSHFINSFLRQSTTVKLSFVNMLYSRGTSLIKYREASQFNVLQACGHYQQFSQAINNGFCEHAFFKSNFAREASQFELLV